MASEWRKTTIGVAFSVNPTRPLKRGSVTPFIPMDALPQHARAVERIDMREYTGSGMRFCNGDTLIARITPCLENGKTAYVSGLCAGEVGHGSTEYIVLSGRAEESDSLFAYYLARSSEFRRYAIGHMEGTSGRQRVPSSAIEKFPITLPPISEQRAIAHILGTLDDKIELNRKQNETLEAMARALFKAWFVDFEPVRAKMEGRWQRGQSLPGLPAHLYDLFPDQLVESEIGEIPEGWEVSTLGKVSSYLSRGISPKYIDAGGVLVLNQKCIRGFAIDFNKGRRHDVTQRGVDGRALEVGDVLVNSTGVGTLGRVAQVRRLAEQTVVDSHVTVVRSVARINPAYLCGFMYMKQPEIEAMGEGSTGQTELSRSKLGAMEILIPSISVLQEYAKLVGAMAESQAQNQDSSDALVSLRDTLLPKLISGELRVSSLNEDATP